jgi:hypothetical protein
MTKYEWHVTTSGSLINLFEVKAVTAPRYDRFDDRWIFHVYLDNRNSIYYEFKDEDSAMTELLDLRTAIQDKVK